MKRVMRIRKGEAMEVISEKAVVSLEDLKRKMAEFAKERDWDQFHSPRNLLLALKSLAAYIKKYAYSNAKTEDLWAVIEKESGEPVTTLMNSWTKQKGYPVVSVTIKDDKLEFEQVWHLALEAPWLIGQLML